MGDEAGLMTLLLHGFPAAGTALTAMAGPAGFHGIFFDAIENRWHQQSGGRARRSQLRWLSCHWLACLSLSERGGIDFKSCETLRSQRSSGDFVRQGNCSETVPSQMLTDYTLAIVIQSRARDELVWRDEASRSTHFTAYMTAKAKARVTGRVYRLVDRDGVVIEQVCE